MATYSMSAPDGNTYRIEGPEGASDEQVRSEILKQHPNAGTAGGGGGDGGSWLSRAAAGFGRGLAKGGLGSDVLHYDPITKSYRTGTSRQEEAQEPTDRVSRLSEMAGEMMLSPSMAGGKAVSGVSRLLGETGVGGAIKSAGAKVGRALGIGAGEDVTRPFAQGSWQEARAADKAAGTLGQRTGSAAIQKLEERSAVLPGGGGLRRALVDPAAQREVMSAQEIATNMGTAAGKFRGFREGRELASQTLAGMLTRDAKGEVDAGKFMENWLQMDPAERARVFGAKAIGGEFEKNMTKLATNIEKIHQLATRRPLRDLAQKIPHKGTAGIVLAASGAWNAGAILHALLNPKVAAVVGGTAALAAGGNKLLATALTNPSTVAWLAAQTTRLVAQTKGQQRGTYDEPLSDMQGDLR